MLKSKRNLDNSSVNIYMSIASNQNMTTQHATTWLHQILFVISLNIIHATAELQTAGNTK